MANNIQKTNNCYEVKITIEDMLMLTRRRFVAEEGMSLEESFMYFIAENGFQSHFFKFLDGGDAKLSKEEEEEEEYPFTIGNQYLVLIGNEVRTATVERAKDDMVMLSFYSSATEQRVEDYTMTVKTFLYARNAAFMEALKIGLHVRLKGRTTPVVVSIIEKGRVTYKDKGTDNSITTPETVKFMDFLGMVDYDA